MKDGSVVERSDLGPADRAVTYLLDRIQHDANLRWYMLHTQAYALLIEAEAARMGVTVGEIETLRWTWKGEAESRADVKRYRDLLDEHGIGY